MRTQPRTAALDLSFPLQDLVSSCSRRPPAARPQPLREAGIRDPISMCRYLAGTTADHPRYGRLELVSDQPFAHGRQVAIMYRPSRTERVRETGEDSRPAEWRLLPRPARMYAGVPTERSSK